jgi:hypothetical protein
MSTHGKRDRTPFVWRFRTEYRAPQNRIFMIVRGLFAALAVFTIFYMLVTNRGGERTTVARLLLMAWVFLPPFAFWAEYWLLWRHDDCSKEEGPLERLKYAQELGRNMWLAFVVLLAAFYFGEGPTPVGHAKASDSAKNSE